MVGGIRKDLSHQLVHRYFVTDLKHGK